jgi:hypothetical protein
MEKQRIEAIINEWHADTDAELDAYLTEVNMALVWNYEPSEFEKEMERIVNDYNADVYAPQNAYMAMICMELDS